MTIGQRMRERRIELNIQPKDIAEKIGKSLSTYYRYETGEIEKLTISKMCEIAEILQVSPIFLLLGLEPETEYGISKRVDINNYSIISFAGKLRDLIRANRLTYEELVSNLKNDYKINLSVSDIKDWENGIQSPEVASFVAISEYFDVSFDFLIGKNSEPLTIKKHTNKVKEPSAKYNEESFIVKNTKKILSASKISIEEIAKRTEIDLNILLNYAAGNTEDINSSHLKLISDVLEIPLVDLMYERNAGPLIEKIAVLNTIQLDLVEEYIDNLLNK